MGEERHDGLAVPGRVVLAREAPFILGLLQVIPFKRQLIGPQSSETLEPRVMQVLVVLARARGDVVTREELIETCWEGRFVGDDAINRTLSRIRQIAAGIGQSSFSVETITKVGYRLVTEATPKRPDVGPAATAAEPVGGSRRKFLIGAGAAAVGGTALGAAWLQPWRYRPNPEAAELVRRGDIAQRAGFADQSRQAVTYFERAVRIDPDYAAAWGMLALAYTHNLEGFGESELDSLPGRIRSAASRALQLDPDNPDAQLALACTPPFYRNWGRLEPKLRRLNDRYPDHWLVNGRYAILLYQVGRLVEGADIHRSVVRRDPMIPGPYAFAATALSSAGQIQEADTLLDQAQDLWPAHPMLWFTRFNHLLYSGRPASAAAFLLNPETRPSLLDEREVAPLLTLARAVEHRRDEDVEAVLAIEQEGARRQARAIPSAAPIFALLGRLDLTFASLERYFLNRGDFGRPAPIGPYTRRYTDFLFSLPMAAARADPRFHRLTEAIGLGSYWRATGSTPFLSRL